MSYDYVTISNKDLADQLHVRVVKSDESYVVIGENDDVKKYLEVVNG